MKFPEKLRQHLEERKKVQTYRRLSLDDPKKIDLYSNDYLGFSRIDFYNNNIGSAGATGSRLLSGNHAIHVETERQIAKFHEAEAALLFNSGYVANLGILSCLPQKGDLILYDELCHASIKEGLRLSLAKFVKFRHNDTKQLTDKLREFSSDRTAIYVITEAIFSMDGDQPDLSAMIEVCEMYGAYLIIDEAHALGVIGNQGEGLSQSLHVHSRILARVYTFGKALGAHGAVVVGDQLLIDYLINFSRSFIYTTAMAPAAIQTIAANYHQLANATILYRDARAKLDENIECFRSCITSFNLQDYFIPNTSAIQCCLLPDTIPVRQAAYFLQQNNFTVKAIVSPTVPKGKERLRFCLHAYTTKDEIKSVLTLLSQFIAERKQNK